VGSVVVVPASAPLANTEYEYAGMTLVPGRNLTKADGVDVTLVEVIMADIDVGAVGTA